MPDVGDLVTASLTVDPYDNTTDAVLVVTLPDGTTVSPPVTGSGGGQTWTAPVTYTQAGVWLLRWTVTGTGASVENQRVSVAPTPGAGLTGRVYATTTQLANYLQAAPPLDAARLLLEASRLLDRDFLIPAVYDVDDDGLPTDAEVAAAFAEAVCAQVEFWEEVGPETDISGPLEGVTIGSVSLQYGAGDNRSGPSYYAPKLARALASLPSSKFRLTVSTGCY
ncbi:MULTISPECIES: hypothetical protein [Streptomyces]|uniref:hypothetical protein n=1 Tax=Streptomyces TaxID=1883 RepID=UPI000766021C|nr:MULTISPECIES: hypothetical protein [Streptomyces]MBE4783910.1 hypothetical protein [Streptomyces caniscabiei]MBE4791591.1 hypothetical protein [Streptomyces caniscabiei]MDX3009172.1 hypothetical protein [Streptomyces caniscabiei]MDX3831393.1 hypothetical protein [Streptomyces europaeiscabiei]